MQRILIVLLAATTAVSAWLALKFNGQLAARDTLIATLTAERDTARAAEKAALAAVDPLKENIDRLTRERDRLQEQARMMPPGFPPGGPMPPPGPGGPEGGGPNLGGLIAMLKTPEGKKMFQNQSASMVRAQYSELAKRLKLSPQDTTVFMGLLADRQTALASARISSGGNSAAEVSAIESDFNGKLKSVLGEAGFNQYNDYEQSVPERMAVTQFADQFNSAGTPLDTNQKENLIQLMQSEREKSPANPFDPAKNDPNTVLNLLKNDTTLSTWEQQQQDYQNRVLQAATSTLTPDQVNTLKQVLEQKTQQDKTALQMFKATGTPPPNPPPR